MKNPRGSFLSAVAAFLIFIGQPGLSAQTSAPAPAKVALVIGNSAYRASPLPNPVNDAADMAAALKDSGFEVIVRTDLDLAGMEQALADFKTLSTGKDAAIFYYAGHGIQVDGENYLIPVQEDIQTTTQVKSRSVGLGDVLERMKESGIRTLLLFLDACRDNPFPGSNRSGARGLAVVQAPAELETFIAYATQPGNTAMDGSGRNGVFTAAMLKNLKIPNANLSDMMTRVIADVKAETGGTQQPRVDNGLSREFFIVDPLFAAARAQAELDRRKSELADLDMAIAKRQAAISALSDGAARRDLELQQQKELAMQAAKKLESEAMALEVARQEAALKSVREAEAEKRALDEARRAEEAKIAEEASRKKMELARLSRPDDSVASYLKQMYDLETAIADIDARFDSMWKKIAQAQESSRKSNEDAILASVKDPFETEAEFKSRIASELRSNQTAFKEVQAQSLSEWSGSRELQRAQFVGKAKTLLAEIAAKDFVLGPGEWLVKAGGFDAEKKSWPVEIKSRRPDFPILFEVLWKIDGPDRNALKEAYNSGDFLIRTGALGARIALKLARVGSAWKLEGSGLALVDITNGKEVWREPSAQRVIGFGLTGSHGTVIGPALLRTTFDIAGAKVMYGDTMLGRLGDDLVLPASGSAKIAVLWDDGARRELPVEVKAGEVLDVKIMRTPTAVLSAPSDPAKENAAVILDSSLSTGDTDGKSPLLARWKFESGQYWTPWAPVGKIVNQWPRSGVYEVSLEIKDRFGLVGRTQARVRVLGTVRVHAFGLYDNGNRDGQANPGEEVRMDLRVQNAGTSMVKGLTVRLVPPDAAMGAYVAEVAAGGAAQAAGILKGDYIKSIGGQGITSTLNALIAAQTPGADVEISVLRAAEKPIDGRVVWEEKQFQLVMGKTDDGKPKLGVSTGNELVPLSGVAVSSKPASYGDLGAGIFKTGYTDSKEADSARLYAGDYGRFTLQVSPMALPGTKVPIAVLFTDSQGNQWRDGIELEVKQTGARMVANRYALYDYGNRDGQANPGEEVRMDLRVQNAGTSMVKDLLVRLVPSDAAMGAYVAEVAAGGAAQAAGILKGDYIKSIGGQGITSTLNALIAAQTPGADVEISVLRAAEKPIDGRVVWEEKQFQLVMGKTDDGKPKLGVSTGNELVPLSGVAVSSKPASYGDLEAAVFKTGYTDSKEADSARLYAGDYGRFTLQVSPMALPGTKVPIAVLFTDSQGNQWRDGIELEVRQTGARMVANRYALYDYGNRDGQANPGEELRMDLRVQNAGTSTVKDLMVRLVPEIHSLSTVTSKPASYGDLGAGIFKTGYTDSKEADTATLNAVNYGRFTIKISSGVKKGSQLAYRVIMSDSQGNIWEDSLTIPVN